MYEIRVLDECDETCLRKCFAVFSYLRPHLDESAFVAACSKQFSQGYKIVYIEERTQVVAVAGFRVLHFLAWGKTLYLDDLITHPEKKRHGHAGALLDWLVAEGERSGCAELHLDTGFQRHDAHRLYIKKGFRLLCHHMARDLKR